MRLHLRRQSPLTERARTKSYSRGRGSVYGARRQSPLTEKTWTKRDDSRGRGHTVGWGASYWAGPRRRQNQCGGGFASSCCSSCSSHTAASLQHKYVQLAYNQRVLNDLQRSRLSRSRMIWLLSYPLLPLTSLSSTSDTQEDWERETTCWPDRGRGWSWSSINHSMLSGYNRWNIIGDIR